MFLDTNLIRRVGFGNSISFATAFKIRTVVDFTPITRELPEGVTICRPTIIAGFDHIEGILQQANQLWNRGQVLARNKSIDLLMRVTCKRQISDAIIASGITKTDSIAMFGIVDSESKIDESVRVINERFAPLGKNDDLLLLTNVKEKYLKKFHRLPTWLSRSQLLSVLKEYSALLVFSK